MTDCQSHALRVRQITASFDLERVDSRDLGLGGELKARRDGSVRRKPRTDFVRF